MYKKLAQLHTGCNMRVEEKTHTERKEIPKGLFDAVRLDSKCWQINSLPLVLCILEENALM